ncbi:transcriptional regulator [Micromonospora sp. WMMA1923]|uniref:transcriptional regulator n=1 Tax=Micromonospora sp. WMMA1923 TaxID=3404125 RepID=UPI003B9403BA
MTELDPVIHAQARLRVVATLATLGQGDLIAFPRLQEILAMTPGNLSVHLRKLEDAGYVEVTKTHRGRTPATLIALTRRGRLAFEEYTDAIRALLTPAAGPPATAGTADVADVAGPTGVAVRTDPAGTAGRKDTT